MSLGISGSSSSRRRTMSRTDREKTGADLRLSVAGLVSALPLGAALAMRVGPRQPDHEREPSGEQTDAEREVAGHARGSWHRACQHVPVRRDIAVNGVRLHCVLEGKGPLVLLLHGFPESAYAWRKQIPALAERFRVVAPDLRGYAESDKPPRVSDYRIPASSPTSSGSSRRSARSVRTSSVMTGAAPSPGQRPRPAPRPSTGSSC